jgi:hypothetical protein
MSETTSEDLFRAAEAELGAAEGSGDEARVASARARWADAAELWVQDLEHAGRPVPDGLHQRVTAYREQTAAG